MVLSQVVEEAMRLAGKEISRGPKKAKVLGEAVALLVESAVQESSGVADQPTTERTKRAEVMTPSFLDDRAKAALDDFCDAIVLTTKRDKLAVVVAFLQTVLDVFPITIAHHVVSCFRHRRWSGDADDLLATVWDINGRRKGFFENIENGESLKLSREGLDYVSELPRRKRRGQTR